jgi:hypothetical protein
MFNEDNPNLFDDQIEILMRLLCFIDEKETEHLW